MRTLESAPEDAKRSPHALQYSISQSTPLLTATLALFLIKSHALLNCPSIVNGGHGFRSSHGNKNEDFSFEVTSPVGIEVL